MESNLDYNFDQPILCNYYDSFSPDIDLTEKYKFISTSELHSILKDGTKSFTLHNGWVIDLFSENSNLSFNLPKKILNLIESYALHQSDQSISDPNVGNSDWIYFKSASVSDLTAGKKSFDDSKSIILLSTSLASSSTNHISLMKKALSDIAATSSLGTDTFTEPSSDVILTHICKAITSPEGMSVPFFEKVMNSFVQKKVLLSAENYTCIATQSVDMGLHSVLKTLRNHKILDEDTVVGILTPCSSSFLETVSSSQYNFKVNCINLEENGMILETEFEKLKNPKLSLLLLANMSDLMISPLTIEKINRLIVEGRQDLIIIQDASLYPFCEKIPRFKNNNTISLFSFKKLFGGTMSQAMIILPANNIVDALYMPAYYEDDVLKAQVFKHYAPAFSKISQLNLAKKIMYDSVHISGRDSSAVVSLQDQVLMCLYAVVDYSKYATKVSKILHERVTLIKSYLGTIDLPQTEFANSTLLGENKQQQHVDDVCNFYININLIQTANALIGKDDFGDYIFKNFNPYELYITIAENHGLIILPGSAMNRNVWDIRVNVAALTDEECAYIGNTLKQQILKLFEKYKEYMKKLDSIKFGIK